MSAPARPPRIAAAVLASLGLALGLAGCLRDNDAFHAETDAATEGETGTETDGETDGETTGETTGDAVDPGAEVSAVDYTLTWSWGQAMPRAGGGWATVNDAGVRFEVTRGSLVAYSAALSPCTAAGSAAPAPTSLGERLLSALAAPSTAWAGHTGIADPSQIEAPQLEDLAAPVDLIYGAASFAATRYCWIHYLAARSTETTLGLPDDLDLVGVTLTLEGTYQVAEGSAEPFTASIDAASGALVPLAGARVDASTGASAHVVVTRDLGHAFDGADPRAQDPEALARVILGNLVGDAEVAITFE